MSATTTSNENQNDEAEDVTTTTTKNIMNTTEFENTETTQQQQPVVDANQHQQTMAHNNEQQLQRNDVENRYTLRQPDNIQREHQNQNHIGMTEKEDHPLENKGNDFEAEYFDLLHKELKSLPGTLQEKTVDWIESLLKKREDMQK